MALARNQIAQLWVQEGGNPKYAALMSNIALRESGGRPGINNRGTNSNGTVDWGLYQVNDIWRKDPVVGPLFQSGKILTPQGATQAAIHILKVQGPKAWATYNPAVDAKYIGAFGASAAQPQAQTPAQPASQPARQPSVAPDAGAQRTALISQYLSNEHAPDALTSLATGLLSMGVSKTVAVKAVPATGAAGNSPVTAPGSVPDQVRTLIERANQIDAKHFNYEWGGGHNPSGSPTHGVGHGSGAGIGFDCSGAVSKVFGINPLVASQFMSWGKPGRGKNVTVYAKSTHVLVEVNGHFFGTSGSNPGGGAGWIPSAALPASYLAGFVARHPAGL